MSLCFYTVATKEYNQFVVPFIASSLWSNPEASVSLLVEDRDRFNEVLNHFPLGKVSIDLIPRRFHYWSPKMAGAIRFVTRPRIYEQYTYIADVDIMVMEAILDDHIKHMKVINKCYSNIVREGQRRLSGLHFGKTDRWYDRLSSIQMEAYSRLIDTDLIKNDEQLLYKITQDLFGLPGKGEVIRGIPRQWRPSHGIHMSLNRTIDGNPSWVITPLRSKQFARMTRSDIWKQMEKLMEPGYLKKIQMIKEHIRNNNLL